jgi:Na+-driven multidrug efflux pump
LFSGITYFASAFFTALNNGLISVLISSFRILVCQIGCILLLPLIFKEEGIWYSMVVSEAIALIFSVSFIISFRKKYNY